MPGLYSNDDYDVAGTIIGIVEKSKIIDKKNVKPGIH
jgi:phosphoribosylformylglycinamidine cyclo-ligase